MLPALSATWGQSILWRPRQVVSAAAMPRGGGCFVAISPREIVESSDRRLPKRHVPDRRRQDCFFTPRCLKSDPIRVPFAIDPRRYKMAIRLLLPYRKTE